MSTIRAGRRKKNKPQGTNSQHEKIHQIFFFCFVFKEKEDRQTHQYFYIINSSHDCTKKRKKSIRINQINTRTSAARPERDRRCVRGEPVDVEPADAAITAAAPPAPPSEAAEDLSACCSAQSSSERNVDIRMGFEDGGAIEGFTPDRTIDHSTLFKRDILAPSPKSNCNSL